MPSSPIPESRIRDIFHEIYNKKATETKMLVKHIAQSIQVEQTHMKNMYVGIQQLKACSACNEAKVKDVIVENDIPEEKESHENFKQESLVIRQK